jgi:hypothetical protein
MNSELLSLLDIYQPIAHNSEVCIGLDYVKSQLAHDETDMSPPYQRGSVWTPEQQRLFMGHLLQGGEVLPLVFNRVPDSGKAEVLDGKQRLEAMLAWLDGKVEAMLDDGRYVHISHLIMGKRYPMGLGRISVRFRYINLPFEARKKFYWRLNSGGTIHTKQQLLDALNAVESK